jgi:hypothetical protein
VAGLIAFSEVFSRRDQGSNTASPSARYLGQEPADLALRDPVPACNLSLTQPFGGDSGDDKTRLRHAWTVTANHSYVLRHAIPIVRKQDLLRTPEGPSMRKPRPHQGPILKAASESATASSALFRLPA